MTRIFGSDANQPPVRILIPLKLNSIYLRNTFQTTTFRSPLLLSKKSLSYDWLLSINSSSPLLEILLRSYLFRSCFFAGRVARTLQLGGIRSPKHKLYIPLVSYTHAGRRITQI